MPGKVHTIAPWPKPFVKPSGEYGAIYSKDSSATTLLSRQGDAVGLNATAGVGWSRGFSDFDNIMPWKGIRLCNLRAEGVVAYEGDEDFRRDGSNGDVMVEIPIFYYKLVDTTTLTEYWISPTPKEGYKVSPMHSYWNEVLPKAYVSAYKLNSSYASISGQSILHNGRQVARPKILEKGPRRYMIDMRAWFTVQLLYLVEFANTNSQATIGAGVTNHTLQPTGGADAVAGHTGRAPGIEGQVSVKYRHLEDLWGNSNSNYGQHLDGIVMYGNRLNTLRPYYCDNPAQYADMTDATVPTGYVDSGVNLGIYAVTATDIYYRDRAYIANREWICLPRTPFGGNGANYYADTTRNLYNATAADTYNYVPMVGGTISSGNGAGLFCYNMQYTHTNAGSHRFIYIPDAEES